MIQRALLASCILIASGLCGSVACAQETAARPPTFHASVGLHLAAVIVAHGGTAMLAGGTLQLLGCSYGGVSSSGGCDVMGAITITGGALLVASIVLGIAATVVHGDTRAARARLAARQEPRAWPLAWLDERGGGLGLTLQF